MPKQKPDFVTIKTYGTPAQKGGDTRDVSGPQGMDVVMEMRAAAHDDLKGVRKALRRNPSDEALKGREKELKGVVKGFSANLRTLRAIEVRKTKDETSEKEERATFYGGEGGPSEGVDSFAANSGGFSFDTGPPSAEEALTYGGTEEFQSAYGAFFGDTPFGEDSGGAYPESPSSEAPDFPDYRKGEDHIIVPYVPYGSTAKRTEAARVVSGRQGMDVVVEMRHDARTDLKEVRKALKRSPGRDRDLETREAELLRVVKRFNSDLRKLKAMEKRKHQEDGPTVVPKENPTVVPKEGFYTGSRFDPQVSGPGPHDGDSQSDALDRFFAQMEHEERYKESTDHFAALMPKPPKPPRMLRKRSPFLSSSEERTKPRKPRKRRSR